MGLKAVANLGGGGGGGISGSGTPGKLAKFTGATALGDSLLSESGTTITSAATAETFGSAQTWTLGAPNSGALVVLSNAGAERTLVLDTISRAVGIGVPTTPSTLLHVSDGVTTFAGTTGAGVRLDRATEALFSSSDGTRSFRAGITGGTAVVGTSTAHDLLLQRANVTAATLQNGAIATVALTAGGTLYTNGTYAQQALTGGTGTGATADIVVAGGIVTSCVVRSPGSGYTAADALSCATIGAGAGFIVTVATIAQTVAGSGNVTALGRIGAGTATPQGGIDVAEGGALINSFTQFFPPSAINATTGALTISSSSQMVQLGTSATEYNFSSVGSGFFYPINITPVITNLSGNFQAIQARPVLKTTSGTPQASCFVGTIQRSAASDLGTTSHSFFNAFFSLATGAASAASYSQSTVRGATVLQAYNAPGSTSEATSFRASVQGNSTHAITTSHGFWQEGLTFSGGTTVANFYGFRLGVQTVTAPSTITNAYGLRLEAFTGTGTITNRWGISQEDTLASNQFSAVTNTFSGIVRATGSTAAAPAFSTPADTDTGLYFPSANTVRIGTGGSPGLEIDSSQNLKFNSGFGSTAAAYGCRVWINFIGSTAVIRGSGGVSSLTRASAGNYTINYTTAMPDTSYSAIATKQSVASNADCQLYDLFASRTTTSSTWVNVEGAAVADSANINIAFFR